MVLAHDLPDHKPHVIMNPTTDSMSNTTPIPVRNVVVKESIGILVNEAQGISLKASANSSSGIRSQPPDARNALSTSKPAPLNNKKILAMPSNIDIIVTPPGREPRRIGVEAEVDERVEGVTGVPHEGQKKLSVFNTVPHFAQFDKYFTLIQFNTI